MIESPIEKLVCDRAEAEGWLVRKLRWLCRRGAPDRFFVKAGRIVLIEFKAPTKTAKGRQSNEIKALLAAGVEVHQCDNPLTAFRILGIDYA